MKNKILLTIVLVLPLLTWGQCPNSSITLTSQAEIDSFNADYPGCTELVSSLILDGSDITNVTSLSSITTIEGTLLVKNTSLNNLSGLENLLSIGVLGIENNSVLSNLSGLDNLAEICQAPIESSIAIRNNALLFSIDALSNVTSSCVDSISIDTNPSLQSLDGLASFQPWETLAITNNNSIENLEGLSGVLNIDYITIKDNANLTSISGLGVSTTISFELVIENNESLMFIDITDPIGISELIINNNPNLVYINGESFVPYNDPLVIVSNNPQLGDIYPFGNPNGLYRYDIHNNDSLANIGFLDGHTQLEGLKITDNDILTSLDGFNIVDIFPGANIIIEDNDVLDDITHMQMVDLSPLSELRIKNNPMLSFCNITSICNYLAQSGNSIIENNDVNCNSVAEVEVECLLSVSEVDLNTVIGIYPNPALENIYINVSESIVYKEAVVYSILGERLEVTSEKSINISTLSEGIYFIEVVTNQGSITKKIVKE